MNLQTLQVELKRLDRRRRTLEKRIETNAARQYRALPARVGLRSVDELVTALLPFGSPRLRSKLNHSSPTNGTAAGGKRRGRPPRRSRGTRYGADVKEAVRQAVMAGQKTVAEISREYGPTTFSIKGWKKQWGLVKGRGRKRAAAAAKKK